MPFLPLNYAHLCTQYPLFFCSNKNNECCFLKLILDAPITPPQINIFNIFSNINKLSIIKFSGKEKKVSLQLTKYILVVKFDLISFWILLSLFSSFLYCFLHNYRFCILSSFLVLFMISVRQKRVSDRLRELNQRVLECLSVVHALVGLIIIALNSRRKLYFFTFSL